MSEIFFKLLDTVGNGTGVKNANVDGSSTPVEFKLTAGPVLHVARLIVLIRDNAVLAAEDYGGITGPLTNGIDVELWKDGALHVDLLDGLPVKSNADWARSSYDVSTTAFGAGDNYIQVRWTFAKAGESLVLNNGDELLVRINDNLTGLVEHCFNLQGVMHNA